MHWFKSEKKVEDDSAPLLDNQNEKLEQPQASMPSDSAQQPAAKQQ